MLINSLFRCRVLNNTHVFSPREQTLPGMLETNPVSEISPHFVYGISPAFNQVFDFAYILSRREHHRCVSVLKLNDRKEKLIMAFDDYSFTSKTLASCKKHNRYQRKEFWETKSLNKLLLAIHQGYVPVGRSLRKIKSEKSKSETEQV